MKHQCKATEAFSGGDAVGIDALRGYSDIVGSTRGIGGEGVIQVGGDIVGDSSILTKRHAKILLLS
jgi:hypothetical protein